MALMSTADLPESMILPEILAEAAEQRAAEQQAANPDPRLTPG